VVEVQEVLRAWLAGAGARPAAERGGVNVKTASAGPLSLEPPRSVQSVGCGKETVRGPSAARP